MRIPGHFRWSCESRSPSLFPNKGSIFQDDNAPIYRGHHRGVVWGSRRRIHLSWLPQSPNLTIMKPLWQIFSPSAGLQQLAQTLSWRNGTIFQCIIPLQDFYKYSPEGRNSTKGKWVTQNLIDRGEMNFTAVVPSLRLLVMSTSKCSNLNLFIYLHMSSDTAVLPSHIFHSKINIKLLTTHCFQQL